MIIIAKDRINENLYSLSVLVLTNFFLSSSPTRKFEKMSIEPINNGSVRENVSLRRLKSMNCRKPITEKRLKSRKIAMDPKKMHLSRYFPERAGP